MEPVGITSPVCSRPGRTDKTQCELDGGDWDTPKCYSRFLRDAYEIIGDLRGDEDSLCETGERCAVPPGRLLRVMPPPPLPAEAAMDSANNDVASVSEVHSRFIRLEGRIAALEASLAPKPLDEGGSVERALCSDISDGVVVVARDWRVQFANGAAADILGVSQAMLTGSPLNEVFAHQMTDEPWVSFARAMADGTTAKVVQRYRCDESTEGWYELSISSTEDGTVGIFRDVSRYEGDRSNHQAQKQRLESQIRQLLLADTINGIIHSHAETSLGLLEKIVYVLPHFWRFPEAARARILTDSVEVQTEGFVETPWLLARSIRVHGKVSGALQMVYLDERPSADTGPFTTEEQQLLKGVAEQVGQLCERRIGAEARRASKTKYRDLMEGHQREGTIKEEEPARPADETEVPRPDDPLQLFAAHTEQPELLCVNETVLGLAEVIVHDVPDDVGIETYLDDQLPPLYCRASEVGQLIMHLLHNAVEAVGDSGVISIETELVTVGQQEEPPDPCLQPGNYLNLTVGDDGPGMDEDTQARASDPLFTTQPGSRQGLGLTFVRHIATQHSGAVKVESEPGKGTLVTVWLRVGDI